jgi:hypothetical protein
MHCVASVSMGRVIWNLWGYILSWDRALYVVVSNGSSSNSSWGGLPIAMAVAESMQSGAL